MNYDVIIIGAGPGGLACAKATATNGLTTLVLDRSMQIGKKVCAGGITWNGLLKKVPADISEKQFFKQHIFTNSQRACVSSPTPIIATVNRQKLGQRMAQSATEAGAELRIGCQVLSIANNNILYLDKVTGKERRVTFKKLVGADGSSSLVRRNLGLPITQVGIGINYQIAGDYPDMQWHLDSSLFANGYAWVFPHRNTVSIGAYVDSRRMKASSLKTNLLHWGERHGYPLRQHKASAELINFDFRGWCFANTFLVGDAAGLASGLTGEGIFSAIISGETVGYFIANPDHDITSLQRLIKNHARHRRIVSFTGRNRILGIFAAEIATFFLRTKIVDFNLIEMAR